ncbi:MAG: hypothetical protein AAF598_12650 [Bacteroidota bacterium]
MLNPNRIWFKDNPWPNGHALEKVRFFGILSENGIFLHLEIASEKYYAAEGWEHIRKIAKAHDSQLEKQNVTDDWLYYSSWLNYHSGHIKPNNPIMLGNAEHSFSMDALHQMVLRLDDPPPIEATWGGLDFDGMAFHCYVLGHDAVAHHQIQIQEANKPFEYDIDWTGKVALAYGGDEDFRYDFIVQLRNLRFEGFDGRPRRELITSGPQKNRWKDVRNERSMEAREQELREWMTQFSSIDQTQLTFRADHQSDWLVFQ